MSPRRIGQVWATRKGHPISLARLAMIRNLDTLDAYATQHNIAPSFHYTGDMEQLRSIAPGAAGRFELRRQIDRMRRALQDAA